MFQSSAKSVDANWVVSAERLTFVSLNQSVTAL